MTVSILIGDVFDRLAELPADHFDCVLTSPPYWGLRSYLDPDNPNKRLEIGCEPSLGEHMEIMVEFCRAVRRVLKPSGVFWLNYGDCYATAPNGRSAADTKAAGKDDRTFRDKPHSTVGPIYRGGPPSAKSTLRGNGHVGGGPKLRSLPPVQMRSNGGEGQHHDRRGGVLKSKDLCLIPQRLAIALQDDGWWVRSLLPWVKRNGMPESVRDRPASGVEYVIMLTKSERYAYDADAVRRKCAQEEDANTFRGGSYVGGEPGRRKVRGNHRRDSFARDHKATAGDHGQKPQHCAEREDVAYRRGEGRNFRNTDLFFDSIETPFGLISAADGTPLALDVCPQGFKEAHFATFPERLALPLLLAGNPLKGPVLDPFGGAGTVGLVASRLGMDCTLIELNEESVAIADRRLRAGLAQVDGPATATSAGPLFDVEAA